MHSLQLALELYRTQYGHYPVSLSTCGVAGTLPNLSWCNSVQTLSNGHWIKDGANGGKTLAEFISSDPVDPTANGTAKWYPKGGDTYFYLGFTKAQGYLLIYGLENPNGAAAQEKTIVLFDGTNYTNFSSQYCTAGNIAAGLVCTGVSEQ
jgi:hypothetical protein